MGPGTGPGGGLGSNALITQLPASAPGGSPLLTEEKVLGEYSTNLDLFGTVDPWGFPPVAPDSVAWVETLAFLAL